MDGKNANLGSIFVQHIIFYMLPLKGTPLSVRKTFNFSLISHFASPP